MNHLPYTRHRGPKTERHIEYKTFLIKNFLITKMTKLLRAKNCSKHFILMSFSSTKPRVRETLLPSSSSLQMKNGGLKRMKDLPRQSPDVTPGRLTQNPWLPDALLAPPQGGEQTVGLGTVPLGAAARQTIIST